MNPKDLSYTTSHEWVRFTDDASVVEVGITDFAQDQMGDLTYVEPPEVGMAVNKGEEMGSVESVKAASEVYAPVTGEVVEVNEALEDNPALVNEDAFGDGWICRIKLSEDPEDLLEADDYEAHIAADK